MGYEFDKFLNFSNISQQGKCSENFNQNQGLSQDVLFVVFF